MISYRGTPLPYLLIRILFKFVLKVFYSSIIIENTDYIPKDGIPCILCANHSNSLTDALILITSVPLSKRKWLRMTAKSTLFGLRTFSSWLIESVGTVPIKRPKDFEGSKVDNSAVFEKLMEALEIGDLVAMFPEGISHYSSGIAPLRSGVARITSDVLNRNKDNPAFTLTLVTCSITYLHRDSFRSDVLVSFNPPIILSTQAHRELFAPSPSSSTSEPKLDGIRQLTSLMQEQIRSGTLDAPNFSLVNVANTARRLYAPLGTRMLLSDHVHVTQRFIDMFAKQKTVQRPNTQDALMTPLLPSMTSSYASAIASSSSSSAHARVGSADEGGLVVERIPPPNESGYFDIKPATANGEVISDDEIDQLASDLRAYQDILNHCGLKDDRVRQGPIRRSILVKRLFIRLSGFFSLLAIAFPGLILWLPVFATAGFFGWRMRSSGRIEDVWDEVAHTKLIYGLLSGVSVWLLATIVTLPISFVTFFAVPIVMWFSLRWLEDAVSSLRAAIALLSMLSIGKKRMRELQAMRQALAERVMRAAIERADLPSDPEVVLDRERKEASIEKGGKVGRLGYFSVRRRRKKDYNEIMRLWDQSSYPM